MRELRGRVIDGLTLLVLVPLLALFARAWLAGLPDDHRDMGAFAAASLLATLLAKALIERLWFHRMDGVVASYAQRPREGISFVTPLLLGGIAMGLSALSLLGLVAPGEMVLGVCSGLPAGLLFAFAREHMRKWWRRLATRHLRSLTRTPLSLTRAAALSVGMGIVGLIMPSRFYLDAIATGFYTLGVILLTAPVNARVVRYMTLVGQTWIPAGVTVVAAVALPALTALRIFAYRALSRLAADWAVAIVIIAAVYAGVTAPPIGPVIVFGAIVWLARRGAGARWLLA